MKKKCLSVYFLKNITIPTLIIEKSRHFSRHYFKNRHYIMSNTVVPPRARKAVALYLNYLSDLL